MMLKIWSIFFTFWIIVLLMLKIINWLTGQRARELKAATTFSPYPIYSPFRPRMIIKSNKNIRKDVIKNFTFMYAST